MDIATRQYGRIVIAAAIVAAFGGCSNFHKQENGQITVRAVSWPAVKKLAEPDAPMPGHKVTLLSPADHSVIAEKATDSTGLAVFDVPPGSYVVVGSSDEPERVEVQPGQTVNLKIIKH
jgi:hypothetical protein